MKQINFINCKIHALTMDQTVAEIHQFLKKKVNCVQIVVNAAKIVKMQNDQLLFNSINKASIVNADGMAVVWASRLLGTPLPERVAGVDLFVKLIFLCEEHNYRPYFLGATDNVLERLIKKLKSEYPKINIAGYQHGYFSKEDEINIVKDIKLKKPDFLFIAFGTPKKEIFIDQWANELNLPYVMGVGGSFDVISGITKRAPISIQKMGLEWLYRIYQEPKRMWKRYAITNTLFILYVIREYIKKIIK